MVEDQYPQGWLSGAAPVSGGDGSANPPAVQRRASRRRLAGVGLVAAGVVAGGVLAGTLGASAATSGTTGSYSASGTTGSEGARPAGNPHTSTPVRSDEKAVSDSVAATLKQNALAAVPGGTVYRVETDSGDAAYEAHMTKADGTEVTVKFDKSLNVTGTEAGMGKGDPAGGGHPGGDHDGDGPQARSGGTTSG